jgi:hypothetical protein
MPERPTWQYNSLLEDIEREKKVRGLKEKQKVTLLPVSMRALPTKQGLHDNQTTSSPGLRPPRAKHSGTVELLETAGPASTIWIATCDQQRQKQGTESKAEDDSCNAKSHHSSKLEWSRFWSLQILPHMLCDQYLREKDTHINILMLKLIGYD